jgi:hypothetical protein
MLKIEIAKRVIGAVLVLILTVSNASAQTTRTWVSGVGDDANPCSRIAPCKTFASALSKTAAGGEIDVLDAGGYGTLTIKQSVTIDGGAGQVASILGGNSVNGIIISAGPNDIVTLRNLSLQGHGEGLHGIHVIGAGTIHIENCVISNFVQKGINVISSTPCRLYVSDTVIRDNVDGKNGGGIYLFPQAGGNVQAVLNRVRLERNTYGIRAEDNSFTTIRDSSISGNDTHGVVAVSTAAKLSINLDRCTVAQNAASGLRAVKDTAEIRFNGCLINNNATGLESVNGGQLVSFINNAVGGNAVDGNSTSTIPVK